MGIVTHGLTRRHVPHHPLYAVWGSMKRRCFDPRVRSYRYYGGRGITVCDRWRDSFAAFIADMGPRPPKHSIERIDNDGNYEPGNCRWATALEQAHNHAPQFTRTTGAAAEASKRRMREAAVRANALRKNPPKVCKQCGGLFERQGYTAEWHQPKYCSQACYHANQHSHQRRLQPQTCAECGRVFQPRLAIRLYCSQPCFYAAKRRSYAS